MSYEGVRDSDVTACVCTAFALFLVTVWGALLFRGQPITWERRGGQDTATLHDRDIEAASPTLLMDIS